MSGQNKDILPLQGPRTAKSDQRFEAYKNTLAGKKQDSVADKKDDEQKQAASSSNSLLPKDEMKILKNWGYLKKTLKLESVIDPLIEKGICTPEEWISLKKSGKSDADIVEDFLYVLLKKSSASYEKFLHALRCKGLTKVANQLEGVSAADVSSTSSLSSGLYIRWLVG